MRYAIIESNIVVNVAESDSALEANWVQSDTAGIGWAYSGGIFTAPEPEPIPPTPVDPYLWLIDIGPYMDRFGATPKMAVLTSADATVKAIITDMMARKYIDLQRADVAQGLAAIGSIVASVTPALQTAILTTPVALVENVWLRNTKVFG
jgi:hypothetical protein